MSDRFYSEEEAQEILRLATHRSGPAGGMSRDRLIEAAAEMGIDPVEILAAEEEVRSRQAKLDLRNQYAKTTQREFFGSVSSLVGTSITLFGINYLTMGGFHGIWSTWAIWPCGFMAIGTLKEGWEYFTSRTTMGDEEFEAWCEKQQKKQRVAEWIESHPGMAPAVKVAQMACAEFGLKDKSHAVKHVEEQTGLKHKEAERLVEAVMREQVWGASPSVSSGYEAARQAVAEVGPDRKLNAIKLTRERTGLDLKQSKDLVDTVISDQKWGALSQAPPRISTYEVARQALSEVGLDHKPEAVELVRRRAGLGLQEAQEAVDAVAELTH